eukprot:GILI01068505.1.p1 GENE.GILI01068505.1~~GILI01068505.1.p1  ORF type:complete len:119 (-),score=6.75 GILI01068505.1:3-359(-)
MTRRGNLADELYKNARLTLEGRKLLIKRISAMGLILAAQAAGSKTTSSQWHVRHRIVQTYLKRIDLALPALLDADTARVRAFNFRLGRVSLEVVFSPQTGHKQSDPSALRAATLQLCP